MVCTQCNHLHGRVGLLTRDSCDLIGAAEMYAFCFQIGIIEIAQGTKNKACRNVGDVTLASQYHIKELLCLPK